MAHAPVATRVHLMLADKEELMIDVIFGARMVYIAYLVVNNTKLHRFICITLCFMVMSTLIVMLQTHDIERAATTRRVAKGRSQRNQDLDCQQH